MLETDFSAFSAPDAAGALHFFLSCFYYKNSHGLDQFEFHDHLISSSYMKKAAPAKWEQPHIRPAGYSN